MRISPALRGGCGLKQTPNSHCALLFYFTCPPGRVRIETLSHFSYLEKLKFHLPSGAGAD